MLTSHGGSLGEDRLNPPREWQRRAGKKQNIVQVVSLVYQTKWLATWRKIDRKLQASGKVPKKNMRDVLEWINRRRHLAQFPIQLQQRPS